MKLRLNENKTEFINLDKECFDFLGYSLMKGGKILLKKETKKRIFQLLSEKIMETDSSERVIGGICGYVKHSESYIKSFFFMFSRRNYLDNRL